MDDFITRYNDYKEKQKRIDEIRKQISLCVSMNMSVPTLVKSKHFEFYTLRIMYSGQEFFCDFITSGEIDLPYIRDVIVHHILKWELKERGIESP